MQEAVIRNLEICGPRVISNIEAKYLEQLKLWVQGSEYIRTSECLLDEHWWQIDEKFI